MCLIKFDKDKISQHNIDLISDYQYNFNIVSDEADGVREHTIEIYLNNIRLFAEWLDDDLENARASDVNKYIETFKSHNTKNLKITTLKKFYDYLIGEKLCEVNPVTKSTIRSKRTGITRDKYLSKDQLKALLNEVELEIRKYKREGKTPYMYAAVKDYAMFQTMFRTGLRVSNVCGIKLTDVDWDNMIITISGDDFKTGKFHQVGISKRLENILRDYLAIRDNLKPKSDLLFVSLRGEKLNGDAVYKSLNKYADRTDCIDKISPHMMRHTCATIMLESKADLKQSSIKTTEIYAHTTEEIIRNSADILDSVL